MIAPVVIDEGFITERLFQDDFATLGKWLRRCGRIVFSELPSALPAPADPGGATRLVKQLGDRRQVTNIEPFGEARNGLAQRLEPAVDRLQGRDAGEFAVLTPFGLICSGLICFVVLRAGEG